MITNIQKWSVSCDKTGCEVEAVTPGEPYWFGAVDLWLTENPGWSVTGDGWVCPRHTEPAPA